MTIEEIIEKCREIFADVLENDSIVLNRETTSNDIQEWDSLNHIQLVVTIEKYFKIKFTASEIQGYKNVGEMCEAIQQKKVDP